MIWSQLGNMPLIIWLFISKNRFWRQKSNWEQSYPRNDKHDKKGEKTKIYYNECKRKPIHLISTVYKVLSYIWFHWNLSWIWYYCFHHLSPYEIEGNWGSSWEICPRMIMSLSLCTQHSTGRIEDTQVFIKEWMWSKLIELKLYPIIFLII